MKKNVRSPQQRKTQEKDFGWFIIPAGGHLKKKTKPNRVSSKT
jgi:hypothetical protein